MEQDNQSREINEIKLALAVLSVQLDALAVRKDGRFLAPSRVPAEEADQSFALRAVRAMRHHS